MEKAEFLQYLKASRLEWDQLVARAKAQEEQEEQTGGSRPDDGDRWSLKDFVAHNIWYEQEIVRLLKTRTLPYGPSDELWAMRDSERNRVLYDLFHDLPLAALLAKEQEIYKELFIEVRKLNDTDLNDPTRFTGMPLDWMPWKVVAENSYEHYNNHLEDLKRLVSRPLESE
jgi:hypothetical protein